MSRIPISHTHLALILCTFVLIGVSGVDHGIWRPDEPYVAGICAEAARTHEFVTPMLNGRPFLEKPPLYYAVAGLSGMVFGPAGDVPFRLASLLFSGLTLLAVFFFTRRREGTGHAFIAALVLATLWGFFRISRWILVDSALVFGVTLAMFAWMEAAEGTRPRVSAAAFGLAAAVAFMAKGLVGPGIIGAAVVADLVRKKEPRLAYTCRPDIMLVCALLPVALWIAALWSGGGWPQVREVLVVNNLMRFTGAQEAASLGHHHGFFYYLAHFPGTLLPWTLVFIPSLALAARKYRQSPALSWLIGPFILLSLASTKRSLYLAPLLPACALMIASWLDEPVRARWERAAVNITWGLVVAGGVAPFAGVFLGVPLVGIAAGVVSAGALLLIDRDSGLRRTSLALAVSMGIVMSLSMGVFYKYRQPSEDYLTPARQAVAMAGNNRIRILEDREIFEGVLPLITGKPVENVPDVGRIEAPGYYLWSDDDKNGIIRELRKGHRFSLFLDRPVGHNRVIRLAYIYPRRAGTGFPDGLAMP